MIQYFAFDFVPKGYLACAGQLLPIQQNAALFALLGTRYGGNGTSNFALPDLRGRSIIGMGTNYTQGEKLGTETATLLTSNMPMHTHSAVGKIAVYQDNVNGSSSTDPTSMYPGSTTTGTLYTATPQANTFLGAPSVVVGNSGGGVPFSTMNPYLALTCTIATVGVFPSRN